jgi:hypothetical protein
VLELPDTDLERQAPAAPAEPVAVGMDMLV